jgi:hypothetical protein
MKRPPPFAIALLVLIGAIILALIILFMFPEGDDCPDGKISLLSNHGWVCAKI